MEKVSFLVTFDREDKITTVTPKRRAPEGKFSFLGELSLQGHHSQQEVICMYVSMCAHCRSVILLSLKMLAPLSLKTRTALSLSIYHCFSMPH